MVLFKLMFWPIMAQLRMMLWPFKMAFHFLMVMLLFANLLVTLFVAATLVIFTVVPTILAGLYGLCWIMKKKKHVGWMGKHGKMHTSMPSPRRYKP